MCGLSLDEGTRRAIMKGELRKEFIERVEAIFNGDD
jgi:hypothetical protein